MRRLALAGLPLLASCAGLGGVNCDNAAQVRAAALVTVKVIDRACPMALGDWNAKGRPPI